MPNTIANKLLSSGLNTDKIRSLFKDYYLNKFPSIDFSNNSPNLFLLDAHVIATKAINDKFLEIKNNLDPETAQGTHLRKIGFIATGILPKLASKTIVKAYITGKKGIWLKKGFEIRNANQQKFFLKNDVFISNQKAVGVEVTKEEGATNYGLILGHQSFGKNKFGSITADSLAQLKDKINYDTGLNLIFTARLEGENLIITAKLDAVDIFISSGLKYAQIKVLAEFEAEKRGAIDFGGTVCSYEELPEINNIEVVSAMLGTAHESDTEFRERISDARLLNAAQNKLALNILKENESVTYIRIIENDTKEKNAEGLPANSIECIVEGGDSYCIARCIWNFKAGVLSYGNVDVLVQDEWGKSHKVSYSRPEKIQVVLKITFSATSAVFINTMELEEPVKLLVSKFIKKYNKIGTDFSLGRLSAYITSNLEKIENTETAAETFKADKKLNSCEKHTNIRVKYREVLVFDVENIALVLRRI